jgi:hypothetical protein
MEKVDDFKKGLSALQQIGLYAIISCNYFATNCTDENE